MKLGTTDIRSVEDLMFVLGNARPGQKVEVTYLRDGRRQTATAVYGQPRSH